MQRLIRTILPDKIINRFDMFIRLLPITDLLLFIPEFRGSAVQSETDHTLQQMLLIQTITIPIPISEALVKKLLPARRIRGQFTVEVFL